MNIGKFRDFKIDLVYYGNQLGREKGSQIIFLHKYFNAFELLFMFLRGFFLIWNISFILKLRLYYQHLN